MWEIRNILLQKQGATHVRITYIRIIMICYLTDQMALNLSKVYYQLDEQMPNEISLSV